MKTVEHIKAGLTEIVDILDRTVQHDADDLTEELRQALTRMEQEIGQAQDDLAEYSPDGLRQELAGLERQQRQIRQLLEEAQALGPEQIRIKTQEADKALVKLKDQRLEDTEQVLVDYDEQTRRLLNEQQEAQRRLQDSQERLASLRRESEELTNREEKANVSLAEWEEKERLRQLRQECLDTARAIHNLRRTLKQKIDESQGANNHV